MRYYSRKKYVVKLEADYGDICETIDIGEFANHDQALQQMEDYYESVKRNIDDAWVIGEIQLIVEYRDTDDDNFASARRKLIKLEAWNMKTGIKLEIKKEE